MPITSYSDLLDGDHFYEGQIADTTNALVRSGLTEDSAIIVPGRAVVKGTGDADLLLPIDATSIFFGIAVKTDALEKRIGYSIDADGNFGYPAKGMNSIPVPYLVQGVIAVKVMSAVSPASPVFWIHTPTPATAQRKGHFRADADTNRAVQLPNARFMRTGAAGSVVPLSINLY